MFLLLFRQVTLGSFLVISLYQRQIQCPGPSVMYENPLKTYLTNVTSLSVHQWANIACFMFWSCVVFLALYLFLFIVLVYFLI